MTDAYDHAQELLQFLPEAGDGGEVPGPYQVMGELGDALLALVAARRSNEAKTIVRQLGTLVEQSPERFREPLLLGLIEHLPEDSPLLAILQQAWRNSKPLTDALKEGIDLIQKWKELRDRTR